MRYDAEHKDETRRRILAAAGRGFRKEGFGGVGVDGLARGAGVTSGAFYGHFRSKAEAFRAAVVAGMAELREGVEAFQATHGPQWVERFADFYFTDRVTCDLAEGCALPSLSGEVTRSDAKIKGAFEAELLSVIEALARGLPTKGSPDRESRAVGMVAMLAGGVTLSRSVRDKALRDKLAQVLRDAVVNLARG